MLLQTACLVTAPPLTHPEPIPAVSGSSALKRPQRLASFGLEKKFLGKGSKAVDSPACSLLGGKLPPSHTRKDLTSHHRLLGSKPPPKRPDTSTPWYQVRDLMKAERAD